MRENDFDGIVVCFPNEFCEWTKVLWPMKCWSRTFVWSTALQVGELK